MTARRDPIDIDVGGVPRAITFSTNSEYLWCGIDEEVQVWRLEDGQQTATMKTTENVLCLAVSGNSKFVAAGTMRGYLFVWDAATYEPVIKHKEDKWNVNGVDFSPDSTRLVLASNNRTAPIWDMATRKRVHALQPHGGWVSAASYSVQGSYIATISSDGYLRLWDSRNPGLPRSLIRVDVDALEYNTGLFWSVSNLFFLSSGEIKNIGGSNESLVSKWIATDGFLNIAVPKHGKFIACSTKHTVSLRDTTTHEPLGDVVEHTQNIRSIAISPDDQLIATGGIDGKIMIHGLFWITESDIRIDDAMLEAWMHDRLAHADALLTTPMLASRNPRQHASLLASRALVHARLERWNDAVVDATESIKIWPSVMGYIAKSAALVGKGEKHKAYRACETAFAYSDSARVHVLLLIKAIIVFTAGEHDDAISRIDDLVDLMGPDSEYYVAYMFLLMGNQHVESGDYPGAIGLFERAQARVRPHTGQTLTIISMISGWKFGGLDTTIRRRLCEALYVAGRIEEAGECLLNTVTAVGEDVCITRPIATWISDFLQRYQMSEKSDGGQPSWAVDFRQRCAIKLEHLGDIATDARQYDEAITYYSAVQSLNPSTQQDVLMKRSKVYIAKGSWEDAIDDANRIIALDPSSPWAYENKHAALHGLGRYDDAIHMFETMLSKISQSSDPDIRARHREYVTPEQTKVAIRAAVENAIRDSPLVLIDTDSGRLLDKSAQASSFESQSVYRELVSAMTKHIDHARIEHEVSQYYRYATLSHKWEENEPLFEHVLRIVVYDLEASLTHDKLQMFCTIVRALGFRWAWSDTCCINKADHFVLQEALVAMFKWYERSAATVVLLRGVRYPPSRGDLVRSVWNTRAWTLQEYHASKVVRFYTEDWKPYLDPDIPNHKESPEIIAEMEEATGVSVGALAALRPGLDNIREKLCLASTRQTTRVEDAAYSLLGMFSVSLPIVYGEGDKAFGRFLAQLLASSGDSSILAWTGQSGTFNSCLPARISVFNQPQTTHTPLALGPAEMDEMTARLRSSSLGAASVMALHDRLQDLPVPSFAGQRMRLPCITFKLGRVSVPQSSAGRVFRAQTTSLGAVQIETEEDISQFSSLYLVYPWIDFLLDRQPVGSAVRAIPEEGANDRLSSTGETPPLPGPSGVASAPEQSRAGWPFRPFGLPFGRRPTIRDRDTASLQPPSTLLETEKQLRALHVLARLRQPFGALLLTPDPGRVAAYRRVATDGLITVRVEAITPTVLNRLVESVGTLDVL